MVTIAASRVWALNTLRRLLWTSHAPIAGGWPSRGCRPGFASCKGAGYLCLCRDLGFPLVATRGALFPAVAGLVLRWQWGIPLQKQRGLLLLPALRHRWSCLGNGPAPPIEGGVPLVSFGAPPNDRMSIATSEGESDQSGDDGSVPLPPSGWSAVPDSDPEMVAMLARAAESVGLEWRPPPCPEPSRLDDWFLGVARAGSQGPTPVPFFPEVHDELTGTWTAPFTARNRSSGSSSLATLDGGAARGYTEVPPVERSVAMQLCPRTASTWRGNPLLPSRACRHSSALTGSAYAACGEAASALHAMALLQVHQAKALREEEEQILLVAPYWPTRTWFPELMLLMTAPPWQIPLRKDLLTQRWGTLWHPHPDLWKLHVWSLDRRGGSRWPTPRGSWHHHFGESTVYETRLRLEVEPVRRVVLFSQRRPPEMPNQSRAILLAARVGAKAVSLHPQGLRGRDCCQPRPCGREVGGEAWLGRQVP